MSKKFLDINGVKHLYSLINTQIINLETVLENILKAIQKDNSADETIAEIEQLIVSYFEEKTAQEVEE